MSAFLDTSPRWHAAVGTTGVWVLAAASVVFWGLRLAAPPESTAPPALVSAPVAVDPAEVAKAFGATTAPVASLAPDAGNRFVLLGVVADDDQRGAALIAVDGKAPRPFRVGQQVGDGYVLQGVDVRAVRLGAGPDTPTLLTIQMPKPVEAPGVNTASQRSANGSGTRFSPVKAPR